MFARLPFTERIARAIASAGTEFVVVWMALNFTALPLRGRGTSSAATAASSSSQVKDPETRAKLTPQYGMGCKRPSVSNDYLRTFNRENVELVTEPIETVTARAASGAGERIARWTRSSSPPASGSPPTRRTTAERRCAAATASTSRPSTPSIASRPTSRSRCPGLPNHFMIFGPYGWTGVLLARAGADRLHPHHPCAGGGLAAAAPTYVEVSEEATDRYHAKVLERMTGSIWFSNSCEGANSYYFDHHGDVPYVRPSSGREAGRAARSFPLSDYRFETLAPAAPARPEREEVAA